jgi:hypothetical protein
MPEQAGASEKWMTDAKFPFTNRTVRRHVWPRHAAQDSSRRERRGPSAVRIRIEGLNGRALAELHQRVWPTVSDDLDRGSMATITERNVRMRRLPIGRGVEQ